jgi:hypothetical protein
MFARIRRALFGSPSLDAAKVGEDMVAGFAEGVGAPHEPDVTLEEFLIRHEGTVETARRVADRAFPFRDDE